MSRPEEHHYIEVWYKRWYQYNKQKIPMIFILIGAFFFTAFLDFDIQGTGIVLQSHIAAIRKFLDTPYNNLSAFYLFAIYLLAIVQVFNGATFAKNQSPMTLYLLTFITVLQAALIGLYTSIFFIEQATRLDYTIDSVARFSFTIMIVGSIFYMIATVFAWFYVDWKYVKEIDE